MLVLLQKLHPHSCCAREDYRFYLMPFLQEKNYFCKQAFLQLFFLCAKGTGQSRSVVIDLLRQGNILSMPKLTLSLVWVREPFDICRVRATA